MKIYVGNLSFGIQEGELQELFAAYGQVASADIIRDRYSGDSRGFGFVEMPNRSEAEAAITALNGKDFKGRTLNVNEARPREDRPRGGGRGRGERREGGGGRW